MVGAVFAATVLVGAPARAGSILTVTTDDSGGPNVDTFCSLNEAVENADDDLQTNADCDGGSGADTIQFADSLGAASIGVYGGVLTVSAGQSLTIQGGGDITLDGDGTNQILSVAGALTLRGLEIYDGSATSGGAAYVASTGNLTVLDSTFNMNHADGAVGLTDGGGAVYNDAGTVVVMRSTFSGNGTEAQGGAIHNYNGYLQIDESTFSSNSAAGGGVDGNAGGAVISGGASAVTSIRNSTFSGSSADASKGAALHIYQGQLVLYNSILANTAVGDDCYAAGGTTITTFANIVEDSTPACGMVYGFLGNLVGFDPSLGSLTGDPAYFPLNLDSPAVDSGHSLNGSDSPTDQAGNPRKADYPSVPNIGFGPPPPIDMGAFELPYACPATRLYVDDTASGLNDGGSWANAFEDLEFALDGLATCPSLREIWVATGEYDPLFDANKIFNVPPGTHLYGGFAGTETALSQQDWQSNVTVLSGDVDNNDLNKDPNGVILDPADIQGTNSWHVVLMDGTTTPITASTVLDGFTITGGWATGGDLNSVGGGLLCNGENGECSPTLSDLLFRGNYGNNGGSGIENYGEGGISSPTVTRVTFAYNEGAAVANYGAFGGTSSGTFRDVIFDHNTAAFGAGMINAAYQGTASPTLINVVFSNNHAGSQGGAMYNDGGSGVSSPTLTNVAFTNNTADGSGGAIYGDGTNSGISSPTLTDVSFDGNESGAQGGAMLNGGFSGTSSPTLSRVTFSNNTAVLNGGAMYNDGSSAGASNPELTNVTFYNNSADDGGAIFNNGDGGEASPVLEHVTFTSNDATVTGGAMYNSAQSSGISDPTLNGVILWADTAPISPEIQNALGTAAIDFSIVQGGCGSISGATCGASNLSANPMLGPLQDNGGLTDTMALMPGSPAIEAASSAGAPLTDQRGLGRPQGARPDIGAYEVLKPVLYPAPSTTACLSPLVGVRLLLEDETRTPSGSFNPAAVTLLVDGINRTAAALSEQLGTSPASIALMHWKPPANLSAGAHSASFSYPTPGGTMTLNWSFTASGAVVCPTSANLDAPLSAEGAPTVGQALAVQAAAASDPGAAATASSAWQTPYRRLIIKR
jgi:predicted outer membrane repeat protein